MNRASFLSSRYPYAQLMPVRPFFVYQLDLNPIYSRIRMPTILFSQFIILSRPHVSEIPRHSAAPQQVLLPPQKRHPIPCLKKSGLWICEKTYSSKAPRKGYIKRDPLENCNRMLTKRQVGDTTVDSPFSFRHEKKKTNHFGHFKIPTRIPVFAFAEHMIRSRAPTAFLPIKAPAAPAPILRNKRREGTRPAFPLSAHDPIRCLSTAETPEPCFSTEMLVWIPLISG